MSLIWAPFADLSLPKFLSQFDSSQSLWGQASKGMDQMCLGGIRDVRGWDGQKSGQDGVQEGTEVASRRRLYGTSWDVYVKTTAQSSAGDGNSLFKLFLGPQV